MANGDGGWDVGKDLQNLGKNPVDTLMSTITNFATLGLVGYEDGKLKAGAATKAVDEGVGEVSGRNMARKATMTAQDNLNKAKAQEEQDRLNALNRQESQERAASARAQSSRSRASGNSAGTPADMEEDLSTQFLGL